MLRAGQPAPAFTLPDADMASFDLSELRGKKHVVLYFYPKDDTPGCTIEAIDFTDHEISLRARHDCVILGVSRDDCISHAEFRDKHGLSVRLLADTECEVCKRFGVWQVKEKDGVKKPGIVRSTFIIDRKGVLRHALYGVNPRAMHSKCWHWSRNWIERKLHANCQGYRRHAELSAPPTPTATRSTTGSARWSTFMAATMASLPGLRRRCTASRSASNWRSSCCLTTPSASTMPSLCASRPFRSSRSIQVGMQFERATEDGEDEIVYTITDIEGYKSLVVDGNHPLAGTALIFNCTVADIRTATAEELEHGHVHGPRGPPPSLSFVIALRQPIGLRAEFVQRFECLARRQFVGVDGGEPIQSRGLASLRPVPANKQRDPVAAD